MPTIAITVTTPQARRIVEALSGLAVPNTDPDLSTPVLISGFVSNQTKAWWKSQVIEYETRTGIINYRNSISTVIDSGLGF